MATYTFETISAAQALAFNPVSDSLTFSTPGTSASHIMVGVDQNSGRLSITSELTGRSVIFGAALNGRETVTFGDGSRLMFGSSYPEPLQGSAGRDLMAGTSGADQLAGGAGNDTLIGGSERDELTGGEGQDLFIIRTPRSYDRFTDEHGRVDRILDWSAADSLSFGPMAGNAGNFAVLAANASTESAKAAADALIARGVIDFVVAPVGLNVFVFADSKQDNGAADSWVNLRGVYLDGVTSLPTITASQIVATPAMPFVGDPLQPPAAPASRGGLALSDIRGNMDAVRLGSLQGAEINGYSSSSLWLTGTGTSAVLSGTGFTYDNNAQLTGGTLTNLYYSLAGTGSYYDGTSSGFVQAFINVGGFSVAPFGAWVATNASEAAISALFSSHQLIVGNVGTDLIRGYGGDDVIYGGDPRTATAATFDSLFGGDGNDQIFASSFPTSSPTFMRGEAGDDYMVGSNGFDDMHGNQGQDTVIGGAGDDWVVGGQGDDMLYGQVGDDIVYGNMGNDTCVGGDGADIVRGGQGDDLVYGDAGNDWLSGDRGNDTLTGGAGADIFYAMRETGRDRVTDFSVREGDRVMLDPGTPYTVYQSGVHTVIDMGGGNQMVLAGVNMAELTTGWIFYG
ncbi:MAG: calcium-binding protein [Brevundimonas sp.]|uniref:calcium-binding protein n=1 Tax=Brevundimonas sp. TaxID=1871086 RepID=UPI002735E9C6|nr:calcium-binding protein [Brevundimonas sp.]MDP3405167.1 calcium-binding protein [Brevundimonas sp.]